MTRIPEPSARGAPVRCAPCGRLNRADRRFCAECGVPLAVPCPGCGAANEPAEKFCGECGRALGRAGGPSGPTAAARAAYTPKHLAEKILGSRAALEGERKQVTVLFADVKGSMDLAADLGPEEWHRVMDGFFAILTEGVHRFEGTVNQYTGDGIMALFGAPLAHEDHAQRACWAALQLRDALRRYADRLRVERGLSFSTRIGLNSGEVVVGKIGDDLRMDYTAQGHTVGLAQRMEALAEPGTACLTEHTARLVGGYFQLRELGPTTVKGVREPIGVHVLEGAGKLRTRLDVARTRGLSRFVARAGEMEVLEGALARALEGHGQVVGVVAEPGVGKSRLCWEFAERCRARGLRVREAHAVAHGKSIPFLPLLEYLRADFGITAEDSALAAREKIAGRVMLLDAQLAETLPLLFDLLGVPETAPPRMDPEACQRQLFAVMRRLGHAQSRREPVVAVLEDLHWIDGGSDAYLADWVEGLGGLRVLLVVNFRPEYHAAWMQRSYYQQLPLQPLGPEESAELLRDLLGSDRSLDGLAAHIHRRTGGNPFFIEEVVQGLVEAGHLEGAKGAYRLARPAAEEAIPATVQAMLAARIDRLGERDKAVLQAAAVIGKEFAEPILRAVAGVPETELAAVLATLARAELVYETALFPEAEYAFKHPLTQEVAYRSQLGERRRDLHAAVAKAIEQRHAGKLDEQAALLAHHWEQAGEALVAADWHRRAAEWVGARDRIEGERHWQRVRALTDHVAESPESLALGALARDQLLLTGQLAGISDGDAATLFSEGMALATKLGSPVFRIRFLIQYSVVRLFAGDVTGALVHHEEALALAERSQDPFLRYIVRLPIEALIVAGQLRRAIALSEEAETLSGGSPDLAAELLGFSPLAVSLIYRAFAFTLTGRLEEADRTLERAREMARARGDTELIVSSRFYSVFLCELLGDGEEALTHARESAAFADKLREGLRAAGFISLGRAHLAAGRASEAVDGLQAGIDLMRSRRTVLNHEALNLGFLAEALAASGDAERARLVAADAVRLARERREVIGEIIALLARVRVALAATADHAADDGIDADLRDATALVEHTGARVYLPFIHVERARLARLRGDETARRCELAEAERLFTAMGAPLRAEQVARELAG